MSAERQRTASTPDPGEHPLERPPRKGTVIFAIVAAAVVFVGIISFLLYRSIAKPEPPSVLVVQGSEAWMDAELLISSHDRPRPYYAVIRPTGRYTVPFFVQPGRYHLLVRLKRAEVYQEDLQIEHGQTKYINLPEEVPPPIATTAPAQP